MKDEIYVKEFKEYIVVDPSSVFEKEYLIKSVNKQIDL